MSPTTALYVGNVRHRRFTPTAHEFRYSLFMVFLDIDHIAQAMAVSRLTSYNTWNWATFDQRDHFGDPATPLRERVRASAEAAGQSLPDGPIFLLTHLRYLGYVFNPISLYYCYDRGGNVRQVLAEVNNTYGGRHTYWLRANGAAGAPLRDVTPKALYVSPFMELAMNYEFILTSPGDTLVAHMNVVRRESPARSASNRVFDATLSLERRAWTAASMRGALARFPWMTAKVITAIHWEALRLHVKGLPTIPQPTKG